MYSEHRIFDPTDPFLQRCFEPSSGIQSFKVTWVSKASAAQRAGRAGRTGPGHCYRIYSSALFENHFDEFAQPEILRMPIEGVVLQMKSMNVDAVVNFPFPTPPDRAALKKAETLLQHLGALQVHSPTISTKSVAGSSITDVGKAMAMFPIAPRLAKMLVTGRQHGCLPYVVVLVAALTVGDPFLREEANQDGEDEEDEMEVDRPEFSTMTSDAQRQKEIRRARRKAFFTSQEVSETCGASLLSTNAICRPIPALVIASLTSSVFSPLLAHSSLREAVISSAQRTL